MDIPLGAQTISALAYTGKWQAVNKRDIRPH
jgi:hypothetical protein